MNESSLSDAALAELLTLNCRIGQFGETIYANSEGQLHRVHGPAVAYPNGSEFWLQYDRLHRTDGPAINWANCTKRWYLNGEVLTEEQWNERVKSL